MDETNVVDRWHNTLMYTDGENPRHYDEYAGATLDDHQYFLSRECNDWVPSTCGSLTYTLYECDLNYKSCNPLPIQYTQYDTRNSLSLVPDKTVDEISLYEGYFETDDEILIFTYSEHLHCYVEGCKILEK